MLAQYRTRSPSHHDARMRGTEIAYGARGGVAYCDRSSGYPHRLVQNAAQYRTHRTGTCSGPDIA
eukprot:2122706-Rhodomonas_salina.1